MRSVRAWQRLQAAKQGLRDAQTAAVCLTSASAHGWTATRTSTSVVPDAVFAEDERDEEGLMRLPKPTREDLQRIVERIARRARAMLRRELGDAELEPDVLDRLRAGSTRCRR